ncbi:MAG: response regulator [Lachnospiraceae bacterium]|nr:response regulator [Lachnospiraceae bacterium]
MMKILIVDDEKMIRMGIKQVIPWSSVGIDEVYTAASGNEAMTIIKEHKPDIMITDISMTEMTGLDLIEEAQKEIKDLRILVLTGYDNFEYARACLRMNVQDFHLKPIDEEVLTESIRKQVESIKEARRQEKESLRQQRTIGSKQQRNLEKIMRNLVHNRIMETEKTTLYEEYKFQPEERLQIAVFVPTLYQQRETGDGQFKVLSIINICLDLIDGRNRGISFMDDDGKIVMALFISETHRSGAETMKTVLDIINDEYDVTPKVILGSVAEGFLNLHVSYNDAMYLLDTDKQDVEEIVLTHYEKSKETLFHGIYEELKKAMCDNTRDVDYVLHVFDSFSKAVEAYNLSDYYASRCCFELAASIFFNYFHYSGETIDNKLNSLYQNLMNVSAIEACEVTRMSVEQVLESEDTQTHEIISKAKRYIEEHLAEDISVSSIATELFITPNYFSRLFKRIMGEGCNEYIVRKRIEKAKSLLEMTTMKTGKIALMVGYRDTNYFSLAFKKHTGVSPTKYRENTQGSESVTEEK